MEKTGRVIRAIFVAVMLIAITFFLFAVFGGNVSGEADIGDFGVDELSEGWSMILDDGSVRNIALPYTVREEYGGHVTLENTLPDTVRDGMHLSLRSSRQDIVIYINGERRADYRAENFRFRRKAPVSAYVICDLYDTDAGRKISIEITSRDNSVNRYNTVTYAYGNNVWFPYIRGSLAIAAAAVVSVIAGVISLVGCLIVRKKVVDTKAILYLAETIIVMGFWILSESSIRQLFFGTPSLSSIFSFLFIEIVAAFGAMYFNEVQEHRYEKMYFTLEVLVLVQVVINTVLNFTGLVDYYDTLIFSHILSAAILLWSFISIMNDIRKKYIRRYIIAAWGMLIVIIAGLMELLNFYLTPLFGLGVFLSVGLIMLLGATILQSIVNTLRQSEHRRLYSEKMTRMTFRTIASTIDAKDQYTGGHSERVGEYAGMICGKIKDKMKLTDSDIGRIKYIGKLHDIGKIGVPDRILNKNGRLSDEEFEIMKRHTVIGSEIVENIDTVEGLQDGVRHHHERYDGTGYPDGLKGEEISLFARVLCLADCFDAMTSDRVYRKKLSRERVIEELERNKGTQFDPELCDVLLDMIKSGEISC